MFRFGVCLVLAGLMIGCGVTGTDSFPKKATEPSTKADPSALEAGKKLVLSTEPTGVKGVIAIRKEAKDGAEVVVVGQVGGSSKPFTEGRAGFLLVDASLKPTAECDCPWDFCELPKKDLAASRVSVKFVDGEGKTLKAGAREMFGIKELSTVVVKGKVVRDDNDNVAVVASGIFVRALKK